VKYIRYSRGDIIYNQDHSVAEAYFIVIRGQVATIKTVTDHDLIYMLKTQNRLRKMIEKNNGEFTMRSVDYSSHEFSNSDQESSDLSNDSVDPKAIKEEDDEILGDSRDEEKQTT